MSTAPKPQLSGDHESSHRLLICLGALLLLIGTTMLVYFPGLPGPFIFDDFSNTTNITPNNGSWQEVIAYSFSNDSGPLNRPVSNLSFALNYLFGGFSGMPEPYPYKVTNLVIHGISALLAPIFLFLALRRMSPTQNRNQLLLIAVSASLLWAIHPLQVSTVLYVVQRMTMLAGLFGFVALIAYLKWFAQESSNTTPRTYFTWMWLGLFLGAVALSVLSKENGILVLLQVLLLNGLLIVKQPVEMKPSSISRFVHWFFCAMPLVLLLFYLALNWDRSAATYEMRNFSLTDRLLTQPLILLHYLRNIFLPNLAEMGLFQDDFPIVRDFSWQALVGLLSIAGMLTVAWWLRRRNQILSFSILWFFAWHLLESSALPLEMVFEHRNYMALLGPMTALCYGLVAIATSLKKIRLAAVFALLAFAVLLGSLTWIRSTYWSENGYLVSTMVRHHPKSARSQSEAAVLAINSGNPQLAMSHIDQAALAAPHDPSYVVLRLLVYCHRPFVEQWVLDESLRDIASSKLPGQGAYAIGRFVEYKARALCPSIPSEFVVSAMDAFINNENYTLPPRHKTNLMRARVKLHLAKAEFAEALDISRQIVEAEPNRPESHMDLAQSLLLAGEFDAAVDVIRKIESNDSFRFRTARYLVPRMLKVVEESRAAAELKQQQNTGDP